MGKLIRLLLVASVLYGAGAHWAALQGAAWAGMLATRVSEASWAEAVSSTFSGEKPCGVCRVVEKGSGADKTAALLRSGPSLELAYSVVAHLNAVLSVSALSVPLPPLARSISSRPFLPPPKTVIPA